MGEVKIWYILKFSPFLIDCIVNVNGVKDDGEGSGEGGDEYEKMGFVYRCTDGQQIDIGDSRVAFESEKLLELFIWFLSSLIILNEPTKTHPNLVDAWV